MFWRWSEAQECGETTQGGLLGQTKLFFSKSSLHLAPLCRVFSWRPVFFCSFPFAPCFFFEEVQYAWTEWSFTEFTIIIEENIWNNILTPVVVQEEAASKSKNLWRLFFCLDITWSRRNFSPSLHARLVLKPKVHLPWPWNWEKMHFQVGEKWKVLVMAEG